MDLAKLIELIKTHWIAFIAAAIVVTPIACKVISLHYEGRMEILKIYTGKMPLATGFKVEDLLPMTDGFSGADIETMCREAGMIALRENIRARKVSFEHFKEAANDLSKTITEEVTKWYEEFGDKLKRRRIESSSKEVIFV